MALLSADPLDHTLLLIGLETGKILVRNLLKTDTTPAFSCLLTIASHVGAVLKLAAGPSSTFYSSGQDGNLTKGQLTGELGLGNIEDEPPAPVETPPGKECYKQYGLPSPDSDVGSPMKIG